MLLFIGNAPSHPKALKKIYKINFVPANTFLLQPMDQVEILT